VLRRVVDGGARRLGGSAARCGNARRVQRGRLAANAIRAFAAEAAHFGATEPWPSAFFHGHAMCSSRAAQSSFAFVKRTVSRTTSKV
jgi:hypothetical protein